MILWFRYTLLNIIEKYYNGAVNMYVTGVDADRYTRPYCLIF